MGQRDPRRWVVPRHFELRGPAGYAAAIALVGLARLASSALPANPPAPYYLSIVLAALWAGRGPGLLAAVFAATSTAYFDLGTGGKFDLDLADLVRLAIFFVLALITGALVASRRETEEALRQSIDDLEELDRAKDEFIATVTHDLRSPLTSILGWAELLRARVDPDDEETRSALGSIIRSARIQSRLVDDLLEMSRVRMGKIEMRRERFDVVQLVEDVLRSFDLEADRQRLSLDRELPDHVVELEGDSQRIEQLLRNLISNAFKFTPGGGRVTVGVSNDSRSVMIIVSDTGSGIPEDLVPRVFERFAQASESREKGGLGLGLAIVRHIAELHGGSVSVSSSGPGLGTTMRVELPVVRSDILHSQP